MNKPWQRTALSLGAALLLFIAAFFNFGPPIFRRVIAAPGRWFQEQFIGHVSVGTWHFLGAVGILLFWGALVWFTLFIVSRVRRAHGV